MLFADAPAISTPVPIPISRLTVTTTLDLDIASFFWTIKYALSLLTPQLITSCQNERLRVVSTPYLRYKQHHSPTSRRSNFQYERFGTYHLPIRLDDVVVLQFSPQRTLPAPTHMPLDSYPLIRKTQNLPATRRAVRKEHSV
jgi:hypothetical protein